MKKQSNHKELHKIAKATLAIVLAGSFTFSATSAFADRSDQTVTNQSVDVQTSSSADVNTPEQTTENQEAPTLVPGDFFYFAKMALEKIKLALTFDDVKEAHLLASNASERLVEAEALFASGDQKVALATINDALEAMKNADNLVEKQQGTEQSADDRQAIDEQTTGDQQASDGQETAVDQVSDEGATKDKVVDDETDVKEVKIVLSNNIIALTAAMEKVKNPVAKAALQNNIAKSYTKLAKKLEKLEKHQAKKQVGTDEGSTTIDEETTTSPAVNTDVTTDQAANDTNNTNQTISEEQVQQASEVEQKNQRVAQQEVKMTQQAAKHVVKAERQRAKHEVKAERKTAKQEVKQTREAAKVFVKEKKEEVKQKQQGSNKEQTGNGRNH